MQPVRGIESILADLTDDGSVEENRAACGAYDGLSQQLVGESSFLAFLWFLETYIEYFCCFW
jgi:hypothetical protein